MSMMEEPWLEDPRKLVRVPPLADRLERQKLLSWVELAETRMRARPEADETWAMLARWRAALLRAVRRMEEERRGS